MKKRLKIVILIIGITLISTITIGGIYYLSTVNVAIYHPPTEERKYSYFHYIPNSATKRSPVRILLYTHSSLQVNSYTEMENYVKQFELFLMKPYCDKYGYALIIMVIPRLWGSYPDYKMNTQSLNRWVMFNNSFDKPEYDFYKRPDLEFIKVINDFKQVLTAEGYIPDSKVYIGGFSNGGFQANRFPILHPDQIKATAIGAAGAYIYPLSTINNTKLTYPVGVADVSSISRTNYNLSLFKKIPHLIFVGEHDNNLENDPVPHSDNFNETDANIINTYFGEIQWERAEYYANFLSSIGMDAEFKKHEGVGHLFTPAMIESMFEFFENY